MLYHDTGILIFLILLLILLNNTTIIIDKFKSTHFILALHLAAIYATTDQKSRSASAFSAMVGIAGQHHSLAQGLSHKGIAGL